MVIRTSWASHQASEPSELTQAAGSSRATPTSKSHSLRRLKLGNGLLRHRPIKPSLSALTIDFEVLPSILALICGHRAGQRWLRRLMRRRSLLRLVLHTLLQLLLIFGLNLRELLLLVICEMLLQHCLVSFLMLRWMSTVSPQVLSRCTLLVDAHLSPCQWLLLLLAQIIILSHDDRAPASRCGSVLGIGVSHSSCS